MDYGANHSHENKHTRYGRMYAEGLYPEWSSEYPLHFLGHSMVSLTTPIFQAFIFDNISGRPDNHQTSTANWEGILRKEVPGHVSDPGLPCSNLQVHVSGAIKTWQILC